MPVSIWSKIKKNIENVQHEKKKALDKLALARKKHGDKKALEAHKREQAVHAESMRIWKAQQELLPEVVYQPISTDSWSRTKKKVYSGDAWGEFAQSYRDNVSKGRVPEARYKCSFCGAISDYPGCNNCKPTMEQKRKRRMIQIFTAGGEVNTKPYR